MSVSVNIGSKIKPMSNSSYMVIHNIYEFEGVEYVAYVWHDKDGNMLKSLSGWISSHVDTLDYYTMVVNSGHHYNI